MSIDRNLATPLVIGAFTLMATTGVLMFFGVDRGANRAVHEWASWAMLLGVTLHVASNWTAFARHLGVNRFARVVLPVSALAIALSFMQPPGASAGPPPPMMALMAVTMAPLERLAALTGKPADALLAELKAAGIPLRDTSQSLAAAIGRDRALEARALQVLFPAPMQPPPRP